MKYTGINLDNVKLNNRSAILRLLNDCGAMSRKDIAIKLRLTPATVTLICNDLLAAGILSEVGEAEEEPRAGRKKVLIDINYQYRYAIAVRIESEQTCIALSDLMGDSCGVKRLDTGIEKDPRTFLTLVVNEAEALLQQHGISKEKVLGVGVSVPGPVDRNTGVSQHAYRIWDEVVPVGEIIGQQLALPVIVENNIVAFAESELIYGVGKERENFLFIKWGPGVGGAIAIQNRIYDSQNSKIAEIGHFIVEKNGKRCYCGRRGCLETKVATSVIAEQVREACTEEAMPNLYWKIKGDVSRIQTSNMAEWIETEDAGMQRVLDDIIEQLARVAVNSMTLLAPDKVIIYGDVFDYPKIEARFRYFCSHYDSAYRNGYIIKSKTNERTEYIGPLAVVMNELFLLAGTQKK